MLEESRIFGIVLKYLNSTFIILIPKRGRLEALVTIGICHYAIISFSKTIASRLKPLLGKSISEEHGSFVA
jgi:hypothetical protein